MSNEELYLNLEILFSKKKLKVFCEINVAAYDMLYTDDYQKGKLPSEYEYDFNWWTNKLKEIE